jgi:hypothetical protein
MMATRTMWYFLYVRLRWFGCGVRLQVLGPGRPVVPVPPFDRSWFGAGGRSDGWNDHRHYAAAPHHG